MQHDSLRQRFRGMLKVAICWLEWERGEQKLPLLSLPSHLSVWRSHEVTSKSFLLSCIPRRWRKFWGGWGRNTIIRRFMWRKRDTRTQASSSRTLTAFASIAWVSACKQIYVSRALCAKSVLGLHWESLECDARGQQGERIHGVELRWQFRMGSRIHVRNNIFNCIPIRYLLIPFHLPIALLFWPIAERNSVFMPWILEIQRGREQRKCPPISTERS